METIEKLIGSLPAVTCVSEYCVDRCYGGHEEGGWWYDWSDFVRVVGVFTSEDEARAFRDRLREAQAVEDRECGHRGRSSVIGGPDTCYYVEDIPGEAQSREQPYYC